MKKMLLLPVAVLAMMVLAGCTSVNVAPKFNSLQKPGSQAIPAAHINVDIDGLYLFGFLPIWTGSAAEDGYAAIFTKTVKLENAVSLLTRVARNEYNAREITDLNSSINSVFFLPPLFSYKSIELSGTAYR